MACEDYASKQDAMDFKTNADTLNEVVTSTGDCTQPAIDGNGKLTFAGFESKLAESQLVGGTAIIGDFADTVKAEITLGNQAYTSKSVANSEDAVWRYIGALPYMPTETEPNSNWALIAQGELKSTALSVGTTYDNIIYSTDLVSLIPGYLFKADSQITYSVPSAAQGKFVDSVTNGVLTTTDASTYNLIKYGVTEFTGFYEMLAYTAHSIGSKVSSGATKWEVLDLNGLISSFSPLSDVHIIDFVADGAVDDTQGFIDAGSYGANVFCAKRDETYKLSTVETTASVTYYGGLDGKTVIETVGGNNNPMFFNRVTGRKLVVKDLTLKGSGLNGIGTATPHFRGVGVWCSAGELEITGCTLYDWSAQAIWTGNISDNWDIDVYVDKCDIHNNTIDQGDGVTDLRGDCMRLERTKNLTVTYNNVAGGLSGIRSQLYCDNVDISHNVVKGSYADVGITVANSSDITIANNKCSGHHSHGIEADSCWGALITDNDCFDNGSHGILLSEYTTPNQPWYAGYIEGVYIAPNEVVWPKKAKISGGMTYGNGKAGVSVTSPEECEVSGVTMLGNSVSDPASLSNLIISTALAAGYVQDVIIKNNVMKQSADCPNAVTISAYQFTADKCVKAYGNILENGKLCALPILGDRNVINFELPNESENAQLSAVADSDFEAVDGTAWVINDPVGAGQASVTWDIRVAPVARSGLARIKVKGASTATKLIIQEYSEDNGVFTFVRTLVNASFSITSDWQNITSLFTTSEADDYNTIRIQFVSDDDLGATCYLCDSQLSFS